MTYTFDKSSGTDVTLETRTGSGTDKTTIYAANGSDVIAEIEFTGYEHLRKRPQEWGVSSGTTNDTLIATSANDFVFWDEDTTSGLSVDNASTRARLYVSGDSQDRDFEVFDLRGGNDILNLTYRDGGPGNPGDYATSATVYGGDGNDTLALSTGADSVYGGSGSDVIYGGGGLDRLWGDAGSTAIDESSGSADTIYSSEGSNATLWGEGGNDVLTGSGEGVETFYGGAGNDTIDNQSGFGDVAYGGSGDDRITIADSAYGGTGNDWIDGGFGGTGVEGQDTIFGDAGNDTLFGYDADDKLYGGVNADTLYGGTENDELYFSSDATSSGSVRLWDGVSGSSFSLALSSHTYSYDTFFGDDGIDTLILDDGDNVFVNSPGDLNTGSGFSVGGVNRMAGIEIVLAGAGADIIGLNHRDTGPGDSNSIYSQTITIAGEDGNDVITSGSGNDLLIGGRLGTGAGTGNDTIFGGDGNDLIYGDSRAGDGSSTGSGNDILYGGAGNDTIFGGDGHDTIYGGPGDDFAYGGAGDDTIYDSGSANGYMSADGSDLVLLNLNNAGLNKAMSVTGVDGLGDGADRVFVGGTYGSVSFALGGSDDLFISSSSGGNGIDRVSGQSGSDVISTWQGNDVIDGGADSDALWGGAGGDTVIGGPGSDYLYGGTGDNDMIYGGADFDYYYWARYDGQGDQIFDEYRGTDLVGQAQNGLIVFSGFDAMGEMPAGTGVFEADHNLTDTVGGDDMVRVYDLDGAGAGTLWRLEVLQGSGAGNYVDFDQRDISAIALWNHDATGGTPVVTYYQWDGNTYSFV